MTAADIFARRVTVFVGEFGSGKSELAVNCAVDLAAAGQAAVLADMDVVKPFYRSRDAAVELERRGVTLVLPPARFRQADLPVLPQGMPFLLTADRRRLVVDVGGGESAVAMAQFAARIVAADDFDVVLVVNSRRPFTATVADAVRMAGQISAVSRLPLTGVVANGHLIGHTSLEVVEEGRRLAGEVADRLGVPLVATAVWRTLAGSVADQERIWPIDRYILYYG
ncbi:MAG: hypothetical protein N3A57_00945 [Negativicutes bacterium]|nr:hypothetical protein [Negativicutes bacterium]